MSDVLVFIGAGAVLFFVWRVARAWGLKRQRKARALARWDMELEEIDAVVNGIVLAVRRGEIVIDDATKNMVFDFWANGVIPEDETTPRALAVFKLLSVIDNERLEVFVLSANYIIGQAETSEPIELAAAMRLVSLAAGAASLGRIARTKDEFRAVSIVMLKALQAVWPTPPAP